MSDKYKETFVSREEWAEIYTARLATMAVEMAERNLIEELDCESQRWLIALAQEREDRLLTEIISGRQKNLELRRRLYRFLRDAEHVAQSAEYFREQIGHAARGTLSAEAVRILTAPKSPHVCHLQDFITNLQRDIYKYEWDAIVHGKIDGEIVE